MRPAAPRASLLIPRVSLLLLVALLAALANTQVAYADRMFLLTAASAQNQTTQIDTTFAEAPSIRVCVVGSNPCMPVGGVAVTFAAPGSGASGTFATAGTNTVTVTSLDTGFATAPAFTANSTTGSYSMRVAAFEPNCGPDPGGGDDPQWCAIPTFFFFTNSANPATRAALISTGDGSNQAAQVNTAFAIQLSAIVFDGSNQPLPGITVTFEAPAGGASGTFAGSGTNTTTAVTDATGAATAGMFTANGTAGPYSVTATVSGSQTVSGEPISTSLALRNTLHNPNGVPNLVSVAAGNNQQTPVLTAFPTNLQVVVLDGSLNYVEGAELVFTAPDSGPSGTFAGGSTTFSTTSGDTGLATATTFTANAIAGSYTVSVTATKNGVSATGVIALTNGGVMTTTTLTIDPPAGAVFGQSVAISATVQPVSGTLVPAGPVTFRSNGAGIGSCTSVNPVGGVATCTLTTLTPGSYSFSAEYAGDAGSQPSSSAVEPYTISKADTTTVITSDLPDPSDVGQAYTVQRSVTAIPPGVGTPTGSVTVSVSGGAETCIAAVAAGSCMLTNTTTGMKTITATYSGDSNFNASMGTAPHTVVDLAVLSITPNYSPTGGIAVDIDGTGFSTVPDATEFVALDLDRSFTAVACTSPTRCTATAPSVEVAPTLTERSPIVARVGGQQSALGPVFVWYGRPGLAALEPAGGPREGGNEVVLVGGTFPTGGTLPGPVTVRFGATVIDLASGCGSPTRCAVTAPAGTDPVAVTITTPGGTSDLLQYTYTQPAQPVIASIEPNFGSGAGGTTVTIIGSGFRPGQGTTRFGHIGPDTGVFADLFDQVSCRDAMTCTARSLPYDPFRPPFTVATVLIHALVDGQMSAPGPGFSWYDAPQLDSLTPSRGPAGGGNTVTLTGGYFRAPPGGAVTVTFGGRDATVVSCAANFFECTVTAPAPAGSGTVEVVLTAVGGASNALPYTYEAALPTITTIDPIRGPEAGDTTVTITGANLRATGLLPDVRFGAARSTTVQCPNDTTCTAVSPAGSGIVDVMVETSAGISNGLPFTYVAPPVAESDSVATQQGRPVIIDVLANATGEGLRVTAVGDPANGTAVIESNSTITYTPDAGFVGTDTFPFTITDVVGQTDSATITVIVQALSPVLNTLSPTTGAAEGGTPVTLTGEFLVNAAGPTTILFGSSTATNVQCSATQCTTNSPQGSGTVPVTVQTSGGISDGLSFTYIAAPVARDDSASTPFETPVTVNVLANDTGDGITLTSVGTPPHGTVTFAAAGAITYTPHTGFSGTDSFPYTITDRVGQTATATVTVQVAAAPPALGGITPAEGPTEGGTRVTISGSGFQPGVTVRFDGLPAGNVSFVTATEIQATTPAHAVGPVAVSAQNPDGQNVSVPGSFIYVELTPTVSSVSPSQGPEAGSTLVSITGSGFRPGETTVSFGGVSATGVDCQSATQCTAVSPPGRGTVNVRVTVGTRTSAETPAASFTYEPPPRPMVLGVQVWRQLPPIVSEGQTEGTIVPVVGGVVEALIGGVVCGQGITDSQGRAQLIVAADPPAHGCGRDGVAISFRVNGAVAAGDPLRFQSGGQAAVTLILPGRMPPPRR